MQTANIQARANEAVATTINSAVAAIISDREFENALRRMFGPLRGSELYRNGNEAVSEAATRVCERCWTRLAKNHPTYDRDEHLAAKAIYDAAAVRMARARAAELPIAAE